MTSLENHPPEPPYRFLHRTTIYIIYDYNRHTDKEILMATFMEEDALWGQYITNKVRLRILVNKATGINPGKEADKERSASILKHSRTVSLPRSEYIALQI